MSKGEARTLWHELISYASDLSLLTAATCWTNSESMTGWGRQGDLQIGR
jgi:hypothetical protein